MSTPTVSPPKDLISLATRFQSALLDSANVDIIGRAHWWDRAKTALETAASSGTAFSEVVSTAARKLQITEAFSARTAEEIAKLTTELADPEVFAEWRELAQSDAVYVTAITRVQRTARKAK